MTPAHVLAGALWDSDIRVLALGEAASATIGGHGRDPYPSGPVDLLRSLRDATWLDRERSEDGRPKEGSR